MPGGALHLLLLDGLSPALAALAGDYLSRPAEPLGPFRGRAYIYIYCIYIYIYIYNKHIHIYIYMYCARNGLLVEVGRIPNLMPWL